MAIYTDINSVNTDNADLVREIEPVVRAAYKAEHPEATINGPLAAEDPNISATIERMNESVRKKGHVDSTDLEATAAEAVRSIDASISPTPEQGQGGAARARQCRARPQGRRGQRSRDGQGDHPV